MKKRFKDKGLLAAPQDDPGVISLINKIEQRFSAIEKKLDILIGQSSKSPFEKNYSQKPFQRFDHSRHHERERQGYGPRERTYTRVICADCSKECEIPFKPSGDRPVYCKECFAKRKESHPFNVNRDKRFEKRDFPRGRRLNKRQDEKRQKPGKKKKPFFHKLKKRT